MSQAPQTTATTKTERYVLIQMRYNIEQSASNQHYNNINQSQRAWRWIHHNKIFNNSLLFLSTDEKKKKLKLKRRKKSPVCCSHKTSKSDLKEEIIV
jgi:hypothetical protein